jgi:hypothetical protein
MRLYFIPGALGAAVSLIKCVSIFTWGIMLSNCSLVIAPGRKITGTPSSAVKSKTVDSTPICVGPSSNMATLALIEQANVPLVGPSANTSGKPSPTSAEHVYHDLQGKIAAILDDGPTQLRSLGYLAYEKRLSLNHLLLF